jgi:hypothetical protein
MRRGAPPRGRGRVGLGGGSTVFPPTARSVAIARPARPPGLFLSPFFQLSGQVDGPSRASVPARPAPHGRNLVAVSGRRRQPGFLATRLVRRPTEMLGAPDSCLVLTRHPSQLQGSRRIHREHPSVDASRPQPMRRGSMASTRPQAINARRGTSQRLGTSPIVRLASFAMFWWSAYSGSRPSRGCRCARRT